MKYPGHIREYMCLAAVLAVVLITPVHGILTLPIPDGDSDSFAWTRDSDNPSTRVGENPRLAVALFEHSISIGNELAVFDVPGVSYASSDAIAARLTTIRGPP